jgi:hypothetical protein
MREVPLSLRASRAVARRSLANRKYVEILKKSVEIWNTWRIEGWTPPELIRHADLSGAEISGWDYPGVRGAKLSKPSSATRSVLMLI